MRLKSLYSLVLILVLTLLAAWVVNPGAQVDPFKWKTNLAIREGLDLQGGLQVVLEARPPAGQVVDANVMAGTRDTIERRVSGLGVSEPLIQTRGSNQIVVELPGLTNSKEAIDILQQTALLEIVSSGSTPLQVGQIITTTLGGPESIATSSPSGTPGATATPVASATPSPAGPVYTTIVQGRDLSDAYPTTNQIQSLVVGFTLKDSAADQFYNFTSSNIGQYMSVVVDKQVINTATINGAIRSQGIIEGMSSQEVNRLVVQLKSGALQVPLQVVQSRTVGPTLGQDSINRSIQAGIIGLSIVGLFMILYYRLPGFLSVLALLLYALFSLAIFKVIGVVLTLAGIAGFILSIGMAVDANVLIFARMKEELRLNRSLSAAIEAGFDHAWSSIRDSNIATMISCGILYWFGRYVGASIIQGFALTLFLGVIVSMFTALTVSRTFLRLMVDFGVAQHPRWYGTSVNSPASAPSTGD